MQKKLVFATNNAHKLDEVRAILGDGVEVVSLAEIGCHDDIPETADTLSGNALLKARWVAERYGLPCFADDTGLMVDCLDGEPGVMSARYAAVNGRGEGHDSQANSRLLLERMAGSENRAAHFSTAIALILPHKEAGRLHEFLVEGRVDGSITTAPRGVDGFGYDPVFQPDGYDRTFAEMTADEKNAISHRRRATEALVKLLQTEALPYC